jgi:hypothetical protein
LRQSDYGLLNNICEVVNTTLHVHDGSCQIALLIALLITWSVALHTQMYAGILLYIYSCTLATEKINFFSSPFYVHSPLKPQIGFAFLGLSIFL